MVITEDKNEGQYQIRAYEPGQITVNDQVYRHSLIISANTLITDWPPQSLPELTDQYFSEIIALKPELVILGTGLQFTMPKASLFAPLYQHKIGIESMGTRAACRTFIALSSEGRNVVGALLIK